MDKQEIKKLVEKAVLSAQKEGKLPSFDMPEIIIECPDREEHGDYSTNIAFSVSKLVGKPSQFVAAVIKEELQDEFGDLVTVLPPGFINFKVSKDELIDSLKEIIKKGAEYGRQKQDKTVVIDYSAPNIAKPFGVGHLRSTIIGQALFNIYQFLGWKCIGDSHLGDWGTQFGKLIVAIKKWGDKGLEKLTIDDLENLYVRFHAESESDETLIDEARDWFKKLEQGDKEARKIWEFCVALSKKEFDRVYKILGIKIDYALGESFYEDKMADVLDDVEKLGIAKKSQGALVIPLKDIDTPLMLLKSDGATTYETRDLATSKYRKEKWSPDLLIYEVGADQKYYFTKVFKASGMLGYGKKEQYVHVAHGLIRWKDRKFSTRRGDTIKLEDILNEAVKKAKEFILETHKKRGEIRADEKGSFEGPIEEIAKIIGIGAVKYNDLSRHYSRDIVFDLDKMISLQGNSGPYIQYTAVRCNSILKKGKKKKVTSFKIDSLNKEEKSVLRALRKFPEIVQQAGDNFSPNIICNFVFDLAQRYNLFYEKHSILEGENKDFRIALTKAVLQILENSLNLLGIEIPKKM